MVDIVSIALTVPDIVETFVKICRAIEAHKNVEQEHKEIVADAVHYSRKLEYYSHFVDHTRQREVGASNGTTVNDAVQMRQSAKVTSNASVADHSSAEPILEDAEELLCDLFQKSLFALETAQKVVDEWAIRLRIDTDKSTRSQLFVARLALSLSDYLTSRRQSDGQKKRKVVLSELGGKAALMIIGAQQIEDAMGRLKHWLRELHDILVASPVLCQHLSMDEAKLLGYRDDSTDDVLFVAVAREREHDSRMMEIIDLDLLSELCPLDDRKGQNLMLVQNEESPYFDCLVDRRNVAHFVRARKEEEALRDTQRIAKLFAEEKDELGHDISASVGILPCCGFARPNSEYHDLVFRLPPGSRKPRTLRSLLLQGEPRHSLNSRLEFSIKLAITLLIMHSLNIVHKNIRPDSIIVVDPIDQAIVDNMKTLGEPYLVAFNTSRSADSVTFPASEISTSERRWASLYSHPRHLQTSVHRRFEMRDDIYSLGICLLEIGLWRSLFIWDEERKIYLNDTSMCDLSAGRYARMLQQMGENPNRSQAWFRQMDLVRLAEDRIPITMGDTFKDVVIECLTFGIGKQSMSDVLKGKAIGTAQMKNQSIAFIRNVLSKLRSLKLS